MRKNQTGGKWITVLLHTAFWMLIFVLPFLLRPSYDDRPAASTRIPQSAFTLFNLLKGLFWVSLFYFNAYVLTPKLIQKRKYLIFTIALLIVISLLSLLEIAYFSIEGQQRPFRLYNFVLFNLFPFLFIITASTAYRIFTLRELEEKKQKEKEAENLKTELSFLRSQISPHFMFNVLNNIVALARKESNQVEPTLIKLSTIMRYFLYENTRGTIDLEKELNYLTSYIELQEQRFGNKKVVELHITGPDSSYQIEPMLLIPFVENAFKHGIIVDQPIIINLSAMDGLLNFTVVNDYEPSDDANKDETSGIGLVNVRRRLELLYHNRYDLSISRSENIYQISLQLKLR